MKMKARKFLAALGIALMLSSTVATTLPLQTVHAEAVDEAEKETPTEEGEDSTPAKAEGDDQNKGEITEPTQSEGGQQDLKDGDKLEQGEGNGTGDGEGIDTLADGADKKDGDEEYAPEPNAQERNLADFILEDKSYVKAEGVTLVEDKVNATVSNHDGLLSVHMEWEIGNLELVSGDSFSYDFPEGLDFDIDGEDASGDIKDGDDVVGSFEITKVNGHDRVTFTYTDKEFIKKSKITGAFTHSAQVHATQEEENKGEKFFTFPGIGTVLVGIQHDGGVNVRKYYKSETDTFTVLVTGVKGTSHGVTVTDTMGENIFISGDIKVYQGEPQYDSKSGKVIGTEISSSLYSIEENANNRGFKWSYNGEIAKGDEISIVYPADMVGKLYFEDSMSEEDLKSLTNTAEVTCDEMGDETKGSESQFMPNFSKKVLEKTGERDAQEKNVIHWTIRVHGHGYMKTVHLQDIKADNFTYIDDSKDIPVTISCNGSAVKTITLAELEAGYDLELTENEPYVITYDTKVCATEVSENVAIKCKNTVKGFFGDGNGHTVDRSDDDEVEALTNTGLISKAIEPVGQTQDGKIEWAITLESLENLKGTIIEDTWEGYPLKLMRGTLRTYGGGCDRINLTKELELGSHITVADILGVDDKDIVTDIYDKDGNAIGFRLDVDAFLKAYADHGYNLKDGVMVMYSTQITSLDSAKAHGYLNKAAVIDSNNKTIGRVQAWGWISGSDALKKSNSYSSGKYVQYTVEVNPSRLDLAEGDSYQLEDVSGKLLSLLPETLKVSKEGGEAKSFNSLRKSDPDHYNYTYDQESRTLTLTVPDETKLTITYTCRITDPKTEGGKIEEGEATNTIDFKGAYFDGFNKHSEIKQYRESSATSKGENTEIRVYKYGEEFGDALEDVTFSLQSVELTDAGAVEKTANVATLTTNEDGIATNKLLRYGKVYRLQETETLEGYVLDETPHFFVFDDAKNSDKYPENVIEDGKEYALELITEDDSENFNIQNEKVKDPSDENPETPGDNTPENPETPGDNTPENPEMPGDNTPENPGNPGGDQPSTPSDNGGNETSSVETPSEPTSNSPLETLRNVLGATRTPAAANGEEAEAPGVLGAMRAFQTGDESLLTSILLLVVAAGAAVCLIIFGRKSKNKKN